MRDAEWCDSDSPSPPSLPSSLSPSPRRIVKASHRGRVTVSSSVGRRSYCADCGNRGDGGVRMMRRVRIEAAAEAAVVASEGTEAVAVAVVEVVVEVEVGGVQSRVMNTVMKPSWHVRNCRVLVQ